MYLVQRPLILDQSQKHFQIYRALLDLWHKNRTKLSIHTSYPLERDPQAFQSIARFNRHQFDAYFNLRLHCNHPHLKHQPSPQLNIRPQQQRDVLRPILLGERQRRLSCKYAGFELEVRLRSIFKKQPNNRLTLTQYGIKQWRLANCLMHYSTQSTEFTYNLGGEAGKC